MYTIVYIIIIIQLQDSHYDENEPGDAAEEFTAEAEASDDKKVSVYVIFIIVYDLYMLYIVYIYCMLYLLLCMIYILYIVYYILYVIYSVYMLYIYCILRSPKVWRKVGIISVLLLLNNVYIVY